MLKDKKVFYERKKKTSLNFKKLVFLANMAAKGGGGKTLARLKKMKKLLGIFWNFSFQKTDTLIIDKKKWLKFFSVKNVSFFWTALLKFKEEHS